MKKCVFLKFQEIFSVSSALRKKKTNYTARSSFVFVGAKIYLMAIFSIRFPGWVEVVNGDLFFSKNTFQVSCGSIWAALALQSGAILEILMMVVVVIGRAQWFLKALILVFGWSSSAEIGGLHLVSISPFIFIEHIKKTVLCFDPTLVIGLWGDFGMHHDMRQKCF